MKRFLKLVKGVGIAAILLVLTLGVTDAVSAKEDGTVYGPVFFDRNMDTALYASKPLSVEDEQPAEELRIGWVQGQVPLYNQLDNVGTEWTSCGPTALAMALNYSASGPTPQEIIEYAVSNTGQNGSPLYKPQDPDKVFTSPRNLYELAKQYGRPQAGRITDEDEAQEKLRALLSQDLPLIVDVTVALTKDEANSAHFVLVTGIGPDNTVTLHDPYGEGRGARVRAVSWDDFYWAWQNNSDGHIGGHGWWMVVRSNGATTVG